MKDPTIEEIRKAVEELEAIRDLPFVPAIEDALELGITMARRYLAMMEEGPVGCVGTDGTVWEGNTKPDDPYDLDMMYPSDAPHRFVYAHTRED